MSRNILIVSGSDAPRVPLARAGLPAHRCSKVQQHFHKLVGPRQRQTQSFARAKLRSSRERGREREREIERAVWWAEGEKRENERRVMGTERDRERAVCDGQKEGRLCDWERERERAVTYHLPVHSFSRVSSTRDGLGFALKISPSFTPEVSPLELEMGKFANCILYFHHSGENLSLSL